MADKIQTMNEEFGKIIFELDNWNQTKCNTNFAIVVVGTGDDASLESHYPLVMYNDSIQTISYQVYPAEKQDLICVAPCIKVSLWINSTYWAEHYESED